ncbi:class I adenylate-forming enzyme family protein [Fastidiosibacter lacustris]|uniref:class I adenylate-forming enzyme family protein n=1 Tax=Fastidiosibacter lacustris TaxID=2056695 RepID=UPI000E357576|nr:class I adenylate-forming enzyme family protein [Fastidiosibacter lacustris]
MLEQSEIQCIEHFFDYLQRIGNHYAFIYNNEAYRYQMLHDNALKISNWLIQQNCHRLMFSISNSPFSVGLFLASWLNAIECFPVNPRFISNELLGLVKRAKPNLLIIESQQNSDVLTAYCQTERIKLYVVDAPMNFLNTITGTPTTKRAVNPIQHKKEGITYHISSGTGGHYNFHGHYTSQILAYAYQRQFDYGLKKGDLSLVHLSFNHAYAFSYQLLPNIALGNSMILAPSFNAKTALHYIKHYEVSALALLPTMYYQLCQQVKQKSLTNHHLRHLSVAGDQPNPMLFQLVKDTFDQPLLNGLGMTEVYGYAQNISKTNEHNKIKLFDDVKIKIQSLKSQQAYPLELKNTPFPIGEIYIQTPIQPISHQGVWLPTGDYGYVDNEHNLYFLGRIKDIIIKGGSNIAPLELEHYLYQIPQIKQAAVVGQKNAIWGELICACLVLKENTILTLEQVNQFLSQYLAQYKHIDKLFYYSQLPINITGKIDRYRLVRDINNETTTKICLP